jgi:hypothetical protein
MGAITVPFLILDLLQKYRFFDDCARMNTDKHGWINDMRPVL